MLKMKFCGFIGTILFLGLFVVPALTFGYEINEKLSIGGILAGAYQYMDGNNLMDTNDGGRGAVPFQPEFSFSPTENDEFFAKFGFAAGNGLDEISPFVIAPWAADLEDDVKNINGRNRDYLLTAWYKHTFQINATNSLALTAGLIDGTDYLDRNAFANDEYTQFMNAALVNGPNVFIPSYDIGGAFEWQCGEFGLAAVIMDIGENDDGNNYQYYALQLGYTLETSLGEGHYRVLVETTSRDFLDPEGENKEQKSAMFLSFDQEFGEIIGGWLRIGRQDDSAAIDFESLYSGGINISGKLWTREHDNIGIGYAYLDGGNKDINNSQVAEVYCRFVLNDFFAATLDVQYMRDKLDGSESLDGFIYGVRLTAEF